MTGVKKSLSRIKLVYRRSSTLLKCVVLVSIALSVAALLTLRSVIIKYNQQIADLRQQIIELEEENEKQKEKNDKIGSVEGIEQIAQDELGLVDPDTVILNPID